MAEKQSTTSQQVLKDKTLKHVGGISDELAGVDPNIDAELVRLSGGP